MSDGERGLYDKYEVYKNGECIEGCFVLEPDGDRAAWFALVEYASHTGNDELASDLLQWAARARTRRGTCSECDEQPIGKFDGEWLCQLHASTRRTDDA